MEFQGPNAASHVPGAARIEVGADRFLVAFPQLADEKEVGQREEQEGPGDKEGGVPEKSSA